MIAATTAILVSCGYAASSAQASYIVTLDQVGSSVVATGIGAIDVTGLTVAGIALNGAGARVTPATGTIVMGTTSFALVDVYTGFTGPTSFGGGVLTVASSGSGDRVAISGRFDLLLVPTGYASNNPLSDTSTYDNATFTSLGVTPGIYKWTWGTGPNQSFTLDAVAPAVPDSGSTLALLALALTVLVGVSRFRSLRFA